MLKKYIYIFLISMIPLIELRGAVPVSQVMGLPIVPSFIVCIIANMLPVPIIYLFARKVLIWGADKPIIGRFFSFCIERREGRQEASGKGRKRSVCCTFTFRRYPTSGNRCMDRNTCCKYPGYGFQVNGCRCHAWSTACRHDYDDSKSGGRVYIPVEFMGSFLRPLLNSTNPATSETIVTTITTTKTTTLLPGSGKNPESVPQRLKSR